MKSHQSKEGQDILSAVQSAMGSTESCDTHFPVRPKPTPISSWYLSYLPPTLQPNSTKLLKDCNTSIRYINEHKKLFLGV